MRPFVKATVRKGFVHETARSGLDDGVVQAADASGRVLVVCALRWDFAQLTIRIRLIMRNEIGRWPHAQCMPTSASNDRLRCGLAANAPWTRRKRVDGGADARGITLFL